MSRGPPQEAKRLEGESDAELQELIQRVYQSDTRERALHNLSKKADRVPDIGEKLWKAPGIIPIFLQEIIAGYPLLSPGVEPPKTALSRLSTVLTMVQKMCGDESIRTSLIDSQIIHYLLPYLRTENSAADSLRIYSLGAMGMLIRSGSPEAVSYLVRQANIFPACLASINLEGRSETGVGKIFSTFVVEKLLQHAGLGYIFQNPERCKQVIKTLGNAIPLHPVEPQEKKVFRTCIRCFAFICKEEKGREFLRDMLPAEILSLTTDFGDENLNKIIGDLRNALKQR